MELNLEISLEDRLRLVLNTLGEFPSQGYFKRDDYLATLRSIAKKEGTNLDSIFEKLGGSSYFNAREVEIPSVRQALVAEQVARAGLISRKIVDPSIPGSRKTGGALIALDRINHIRALAGDCKIKTLYACPGHLIPKMQNEARLFLGNDIKMVAITQDNRAKDIIKASTPNVDIVFLGYEMSFRTLGEQDTDPSNLKRSFIEYCKALGEFPTRDSALDEIRRIAGDQKAERLYFEQAPIEKIIENIVHARIRRDELSVMQALEQKVFPSNGEYYVILDEIHNLVADDSKTAIALGGFFRKAQWGAALTGTLMGNYINNDAFLAYLLGIVDDPKDYSRLVKGNALKVKMAFKPFTAVRVVSDIREVDLEIPQEINKIMEYSPHLEIVKLHIELENARCFSTGEKILLSRYLLTNPEKLDPESFENVKEGSMWDRLTEFLEENPLRTELLKSAIEKGSSRVDAIAEILQNHPSEKALIFTVYSSTTTDYLKDQLKNKGFDFEAIDQRVSTSINGDGLSDRMLIWKRSQYMPEKHGAIGSIGTCREGQDGQAYSILIYYEIPSVPFHKKQADGRAIRSGQRNVVKIYELVAQGIPTDRIIIDFRKWKEEKAAVYYSNEDPLPEELDKYLADVAKERIPTLAILANLDSRGYLTLFFNANVGKGSKEFYRALTLANNHLFMVERFNLNYETSHSANVGRLLKSIIHGEIESEEEKIPGIEKLLEKEIKNVADLGCGPAMYSRCTGHQSINIDLSRLQLEYGEESIKKQQILGNSYFLGSIHDLSYLVSIDDTSDLVFEPGKTYDNHTGLKDRSLDLAVCSNVFAFLNMDERKYFFKEVKRTLAEGSYLVLVLPRSEISEECEKNFLKDMQDSGFDIDENLSGEYSARQAYNSETGLIISDPDFRSVVIVAKNNSSEINYDLERTYFVLHNEYEVRDGKIKTKEREEAERIGQRSRFICQGFYRSSILDIQTSENREDEQDKSKEGYESLDSTVTVQIINTDDSPDRLAENGSYSPLIQTLGLIRDDPDLKDDIKGIFRNFGKVLGNEGDQK